MADVILFQPGTERAYSSNLTDFIDFSKNTLTALSERPNWTWEGLSWEGIGSFTKHGYRFSYKNAHKAPVESYMAPAFTEFAKAFIRYKLSTTGGKVNHFLIPLRALEEALLSVIQSDDISKLSSNVLDQAAVNIRAYTKIKTARYDHGRRLQVISEFLMEKGLAPATSWKSPFSSVKRYNSRLDALSKQKASKKLPSDTALNALAEIFSLNPENSQDRFATSYAALLMCAPSRLSEVLSLDVNCIHKEEDSGGNIQIGLRWYAKKGGKPSIKYIPSSMQQIVEEAVNRLKLLSEPGREVAKWYEKNDGAFFRPKSMRHIPDNQPLTVYQICELLNVSSNNTSGINEVVRQYLRNNPEIYEKMLVNGGIITFADLNKVSREKLPENFPYMDKDLGLKWSNSLFCYRLNELHYKSIRPYQLWAPSGQIFNSLICKSKGRKNIFERYGYKEIDGSTISLTSHQFRHFLNTLAQKGAVGELDIAKWSGRANIHQNNVYNHMTDNDHLDRVTSTEIMASISKPLAKIKMKNINAPVTVADLEATTSSHDRVAHVTEFGFCVHDFAFSPCQKYADCLNCSEQVCIKGDDEKLERLKHQRILLVKQLKNATQAEALEVWGANRWVSHQSRTIERLDKLIDILDSSEVEHGAIIRLKSDYEDTQVKRELGKSVVDDKSISISLESVKKLLEN
ncbi:MAG: integrase [Kangiella sp.]|nr:integrase [Kangiella sp.]